jgi:hypothetical protein
MLMLLPKWMCTACLLTFKRTGAGLVVVGPQWYGLGGWQPGLLQPSAAAAAPGAES